MINDITGKVNPVTETDKRYDYFCSVCNRWFLCDCVVIDWITPREITCKHCGNDNILSDTWEAENEPR